MWQFVYSRSTSLPPLAWLARVRYPVVEVSCGASVTAADDGFFEGTWSGDATLASIAGATTVFGSGMIRHGETLLVIPPSHTMEGVFATPTGAGTVIANSLVAALVGAGTRPIAGVDYPTLFSSASDGIGNSPIVIPTSGEPVRFHLYDNMELRPDGSLVRVDKPREAAFATYGEYVARLKNALESALANARGYEPVVAVSSGYDSTAVAVLAAEAGCRRAYTFEIARAAPGATDFNDSGAPTAKRLGMEVETFDRLGYVRRDDLAEAEFLATGATGEDVAMAAFEPRVTRKVLINGMVGGALWRRIRPRRTDLWRTDLSGCSLGEFRVRCDFIYLPLPTFGMSQQPSVQDVALSREMRPYSVGGTYDEPIPRRIAEDAGIPRGSFATIKRGATALLHLHGAEAFAPTTLASARAFAAAEGQMLELRRRAPLRRRDRAVLRIARLLRLSRVSAPIERRRRQLVQFEPREGSLLFRWAVDVIRPRYGSLAPGASAVRRESSEQMPP